MRLLFAFGMLAALVPCASHAQKKSDTIPALTPLWISEKHPAADMDSPAAWRAPSGQVWVIATAKKGNVLYVIDGVSGKSLRTVGTAGTRVGQFARPNGVAVWGDVALVVERDNQRVQAFQLPSFKSIGMIGDASLVKPYGLTVLVRDATTADLFVTDNQDLSPYPEEHAMALAKRIRKFRLTRTATGVKSDFVKQFGDTSGDGALRKVESIAGDASADRIVVADELAQDLNVFTTDGVFTSSFGKKRYHGDPEGIVLYGCGATAGYWISTDQSARRNRFHVYDRTGFAYRGTFTIAGVAMTDGIALLQGTVGPMQGALYALNHDDNVAAVSIAEVFAALELPDPCPAIASPVGAKAAPAAARSAPAAKPTSPAKVPAHKP